MASEFFHGSRVAALVSRHFNSSVRWISLPSLDRANSFLFGEFSINGLNLLYLFGWRCLFQDLLNGGCMLGLEAKNGLGANVEGADRSLPGPLRCWSNFGVF